LARLTALAQRVNVVSFERRAGPGEAWDGGAGFSGGNVPAWAGELAATETLAAIAASAAGARVLGLNL
jgi:hypothetical protein